MLQPLAAINVITEGGAEFVAFMLILSHDRPYEGHI